MKHKIKVLIAAFIMLFVFAMVACTRTNGSKEKVQAAKDALSIEFAEGDTATSVTKDIDLPNSWEEVNISWVSSNTDVITEQGLVTRQAIDTEVLLTATLSYDGESDTKDFELLVLAETRTDEQIIEDVKNSLSILFTADGDTLSHVTDDLILTTVLEGVAISWQSSDASVVSTSGAVNRQDVDVIVELTALLTRGSATDNKHFTVTIKADSENLLLYAKASLLAYYDTTLAIDGFELIQNIELITNIEQATVYWSSSHPDIVSTNGVVIRPAFDQNDISVTLTATVEINGLSDTIDFTVLVLSQREVIEEVIIQDTQTIEASSTDFGYFSENGIVVSYLETFKYTTIGSRSILEVNEVVSAMPLIYIIKIDDYREDFQTYMAQFELPSTYDVVSYGFITSTQAVPLTLSTPQATIYQSNALKAETNEFLTSFDESLGISSVRAYVTFDGSEGIQTIYSLVNFGVEVYEVSFDDDIQYVLHGQQVALPDTPSRAGYRFDGWFVNDVLFDKDTVVTSDLVIESKWTEKESYIEGNVSDLWQQVEGVLISFGDQSVLTDSSGYFKIENITAQSDKLVLSKAAYMTKEIDIKKSDFSDLDVLELGPVNLALDFVELGELGGNNTILWDGYHTRDKNQLIFRFITNQVNEAHGRDGIGVFLSVTDEAGTVRSTYEILFGFYLGDYIVVDHYPNNVKTRLVSGYYSLPNGISIDVEIKNDQAIMTGYIPFNAISQLMGESFDAYRTYGLSMTSDDLSRNTWDLWYRPDLPGITGNNGEVVRANPRDYIRIASDNTLFNAINNFDTYVYGYTTPDAEITLGNLVVHSDAEGLYGFAFNRTESQLTLSVSKDGFYPFETTLELLDQVTVYQVPLSDLEEVTTDIEITVIDANTQLELSDVMVIHNSLTYQTDEMGIVYIENVSVSGDVTLVFEKDDYFTYDLVILTSDLDNSTYRTTVSLYPVDYEVRYSGYVIDVFGPVSGATVLLENLDLTITTDETGYYEFDQITLDQYTFIVTSNDHETLTELVSPGQATNGEVIKYFDLFLVSAEIGEVGVYTKNVTIWHGSLTRNNSFIKLVFTTAELIDISLNSNEQLDLFFHLKYPTSYMRTDYTFNINVAANNQINVYQYPNDAKILTESFVPSLEKGIDAAWVQDENGTRVEVLIDWEYFASVDAQYAQNSQSDIWFTMNTVRGNTYHWWTREDLPGVFTDGNYAVNREVPVDYVRFDINNELSVLENYTLEMFAEQVALSSANHENYEFSLENMATAQAMEIRTIATGELLFSDRPNFHFLDDIIEVVKGLQFTHGSIDGFVPTTVTEAGYMVMIIPFGNPGSVHGYDVLNEQIATDDWLLIVDRQIRVRGSNIGDYLNYYVKWVEAGDVIQYGKWNIPVYINSEGV